MKVFLDTNIFLEYFEQRREYQAVSQLLSAVEDGKLKAVVSAGCVYTLAYLIRMELKRQGIHRPAHDRDAQDTGFGHGDVLFAGVHNEQGAGELLHFADAAQVGLQLFEIGRASCRERV